MGPINILFSYMMYLRVIYQWSMTYIIDIIKKFNNMEWNRIDMLRFNKSIVIKYVFNKVVYMKNLYTMTINRTCATQNDTGNYYSIILKDKLW